MRGNIREDGNWTQQNRSLQKRKCRSRWVEPQRDEAHWEPLQHVLGGLGPAYGTGDWLDTAAIVSQLDLVITPDTAITHLAGALARPVWLALCCRSEWRWMRHRDDSPWYPTMRLFRQDRLGDWGPVFRRMAEELSRSLSS